jgi:PAT family beta-lactamase induction signal transducer AmpG
MQSERRLPPIWIMGMTNAVSGLTGGFCAVILPDLLAADGLSAGKPNLQWSRFWCFNRMY